MLVLMSARYLSISRTSCLVLHQVRPRFEGLVATSRPSSAPVSCGILSCAGSENPELTYEFHASGLVDDHFNSPNSAEGWCDAETSG